MISMTSTIAMTAMTSTSAMNAMNAMTAMDGCDDCGDCDGRVHKRETRAHHAATTTLHTHQLLRYKKIDVVRSSVYF